MRGKPVVLSLFPGAGLLDLAFETVGFCVVRGPEWLLGGDIRGWHVPPGRFDGVIGGPPCPFHSLARYGGNPDNPKCAQPPVHPNLIPEFERIVIEASPIFWMMEDVKEAPAPNLEDMCYEEVLDAWEFGASQHRRRRFCSNLPLEPERMPEEIRHPDPWPCVTATENRYGPTGTHGERRASRKVGRRMTLMEVSQAMGLATELNLPALTNEMKYKVLGNGVPLEMGTALALAIRSCLVKYNLMEIW